MHPTFMRGFAVCMATALVACAQSRVQNPLPVIRHDAVTAAARGQSLTVRATVTDEGKIHSVMLYCAASQDMTPVRIGMQATGAGIYLASVPENLLNGDEFSYYIEAIDDQEGVSETPWYHVRLQARNSPKIPAQAGEDDEAPPSWKKPALIAAGALAVAGGAALALSGGGGGGGGDSTDTNTPPPAVTNTGTYAGTRTLCLEMSGTSPDCQSKAITFTISSDNRIVSETLLDTPTRLESTLSGNDFTLYAPVNSSNLTGTIRFVGTVFSGRITGSIDGDVRTDSGSSGSYSGTFNALRQSTP